MDEKINNKTTTVAVKKDVMDKLFGIRCILIKEVKKDISYSYAVDYLIDYYNKNNQGSEANG